MLNVEIQITQIKLLVTHIGRGFEYILIIILDDVKNKIGKLSRRVPITRVVSHGLLLYVGGVKGCVYVCM